MLHQSHAVEERRNARQLFGVPTIAELKGVIERSDVVQWHRRMFDEDYSFLKGRAADNLFKIKGPVVKAYVWLLMRQEELARSTRGGRAVKVTDRLPAASRGPPFGPTDKREHRHRMWGPRSRVAPEIPGPPLPHSGLKRALRPEWSNAGWY